MTNRIEERVHILRGEIRAGLAAYLVAGAPDMDATLQAMETLVASGVSLLEIGMPFSDPVADGPVIAAAHAVALRGGASLRGTLELVDRFRALDRATPVVLMGYVNPVLSMGLDAFFTEAAQAGVDAAILVDLPLEHSEPWRLAARAQGVALVPLLAPTTTPDRERRILSSADDLVYLVARTGVTGAAEADVDAVRERSARVRACSNVPVAAGFGIRSADHARALVGSVDFVVVGSLFVETLARGGKDALPELGRVARELRAALEEA